MKQVPIAASLTGRSTAQAVLVWCQVKLASLPENIDNIKNIITNNITNIFTISITNMSIILVSRYWPPFLRFFCYQDYWSASLTIMP